MRIWSSYFGPFNRTQEVHHNVLLSSWVIHNRMSPFLGEITRLRSRGLSCLRMTSSCLWCEEIGYNVLLWVLIQSTTPSCLDEDSSPPQESPLRRLFLISGCSYILLPCEIHRRELLVTHIGFHQTPDSEH